jgi:S1-C subfamily serine protease
MTEDNKTNNSVLSEKEKKSSEEQINKENMIFREKIKSYFIIGLIVFFCLNILSVFFIWIYAESVARKENIATYNRFIEHFNESLREQMKEEILKENAKQHYIPDDYVSISQHAYREGRASVVEIASEGTAGSAGGTRRTTGVILNEQGYILTNAHAVIRNFPTITYPVDEETFDIYDSITCTVYQKGEYDLEVIAFDVYSDLALMKIDNPPDGLKPVTFGDSDYVSIGEDAAVLGNPWGLGISVISGTIANNKSYVVPASEPEITVDMLQLNIALIEGNSGAPVLNFYAEMIGLVSFQISKGGIASIGFAVSVNEIKAYIDKINDEQGLDIQYKLSENI